MGQCTSNSQKEKQPSYRYHDPVDTHALKIKHLAKLNFHAAIANLALTKCPYKQAFPIFRLSQYWSFALEGKSQTHDETIKWKVQQKFDFQMCEFELRKSFLLVEICNESRKVLGSIKINLYLIATGPFHQDFAIEYEKGQIGRISFDFKLSQIIQVTIRTQAAEIELLKDHPDQEFTHSIKTIAGYNGEVSESDLSYPAIVLLQKKILEVPQEARQNQKKQSYLVDEKEHKKSIKEVEVGKKIIWHKEDGLLPILTTKVLASQLHNTYFQVLIWKCQGSGPSAKSQFFADTYVSFYKLFASEGKRIKQGECELESRSINITEKIEHYGKDYGKGIFSFNIINQPYFKQYQICVHTELGVLKTAPIFGVMETKSEQICPQLKELLFISERIQQDVLNLNNLQSTAQARHQIRKNKNQIEINLERTFNLLQKSSHLPSFLYKYNSKGELLKGQKILVALGMKTIEYLEIQDPIIKDICWLILISIIKRNEFSLSHMGFQQSQKILITNNQVNEHLKEKLKLVNIFKIFTYKLLNLALSALNRKGSEYQSIFAEVYCACAYFKIPQFRKAILKLITNNSDPEINEWRGIEFNLHEDLQQSIISKHANIFSELFDWESQFYNWINDEQPEGESLSDILSQSSWKEKFRSRGFQFFYFLKYWVTHIESNLTLKKDIQWRYFPGYNRLLQGFFSEMKKIPILQYPDALIESCLKLLANEKLINPIMMIMLNKVNVYDPSAVIRAIEYLNLIFLSFTNKKKFLPISFNYSYFFKSLKIILESESSMGISSALTLIYNHFNLYHIEFRRNLSMYMLGKIFWKLFLNWSYTVRKTFYYLITYKIYGQAYYSKKTGSCYRLIISDSQIIQRYKQIMKIASNNEKQQQTKRINSFDYVNDQQYYKKMKMKAYQKIRKNTSQCSSFVNKTKASSFKEASEFKCGSMVVQLKQYPKHNRSQLNLAQEKEYHSQHYLKVKKDDLTTSKVHDDNFCDEQNHNFILFQKIIHEQEFEIQQVECGKLKYIAIYMPEFKTIQRYFMKSLERGDHECPPVSYEISIDNREIRPKEIDNW